MKENLSFALIRLAMGLVGLLPRPTIRWIGEAGGRLWARVAGDRRLMARRHMSRVLGQGANLDRATTDLFASYGRYWAETLWVRPRRIPDIKRTLTITGLENLTKAAAEKKGVVLVLPHVGNWEPAALCGEAAGIEIAAVAERLPNRRLTAWFVSMRAQYGITIIPHGRAAMRQAAQAVERGAAVALLCDRDLSGRGVRVEFFGEETTLPVGPAALALRMGVSVVSAATYFDGAGHRVDLEPVPIEGLDDVQKVTQAIAHSLETIIRREPEQWHLMQPNWPSDRQK